MWPEHASYPINKTMDNDPGWEQNGTEQKLY